ncbi:sensor histidine kinase [Streptomyces sp. NPDC057438]|uniref:sensor histidine kinase n=1 Tax=Streptomyces sp. NPDC057438 TaxID=3346133 RepID=UPI0036B69011
MPVGIDLSAYRIVQEALTNVIRHAGTGHCRVAIDYGDEELSVEIVDDGRGVTGNGSAHGFGGPAHPPAPRTGVAHSVNA